MCAGILLENWIKMFNKKNGMLKDDWQMCLKCILIITLNINIIASIKMYSMRMCFEYGCVLNCH